MAVDNLQKFTGAIDPKKNWPLFLLLSVGWEIIELFIPFNFAIETTINKITDIFMNVIGYSFGVFFK